MKIALIAPPFIAVPPKNYGGTELFIADLAKGLKEKGIDVVLYTNGESTAPVECRYLFEKEEWPAKLPIERNLKQLSHASWAVQDASRDADVIHVNSALAVACSRFVKIPFVCTIHHTSEDKQIAAYYATFPGVHYVTISDAQQRELSMPKMLTIHHGIHLDVYRLFENKEPYLSFLGRVAESKGTHNAIEIAKKSGIPLKIAGDIQPENQEYWETKIKPHVDGRFIEYLGRVGLKEKNELLGKSLAMLFPIEWEEPFGLVMVESMACGTPVLAMPKGSVPEIVKDGVSGFIRESVDELAKCAKNLNLAPEKVREFVEQNFSIKRMVDHYIRLYAELVAPEQSLGEPERIVA